MGNEKDDDKPPEKALDEGVVAAGVPVPRMSNELAAADAAVRAKAPVVDVSTLKPLEPATPVTDVGVGVGLSSTETVTSATQTMTSNTTESILAVEDPEKRQEQPGGATGPGAATLGMPALSRGNYQQPTATPGAFGVSGVNGPVVAAEESSSEEDDDEETAAAPNNDGLAVAAPVTDEARRDIENARLVMPNAAQEAKRKQKNFLMTIGVLCAIAIVVFIIIFFVVQGDKNDGTSEETSAPAVTYNATSAPLEPTELLKSLLPDHTLPKLVSEATPQSRAFKWLIEDPNFTNYTNKRLQQRFALATFYYSSDGEAWGPDWLNITQHECMWADFMPGGKEYDRGQEYRHYEYKYIDGPCFPIGYNSTALVNATEYPSDFPDDYLYLAMTGQELGGELPAEVSMLSSLKLVQFDYTTMIGTVPTILANLTGLRELHLFGSAFSGAVPSELARLTDLRILVMGGSEYLTGTLPSELGLLSNNRILKIAESNVTGTVPLEYTGLTPLMFQLYRNNLFGTIHTEFGLFSTVEWFMLERNELVGTIPSELGMMSKLDLMYLHENHVLSGTIPTELGLISNYRLQFYLHTNALTGTIPTEFGQATDDFWRLRLDWNQLTGKIPSELALTTSMHVLSLQDNLLTGTIPTVVAAQFRLQYFRVQLNHLSGIIPSEFTVGARKTKFIQFHIDNNDFSGTIPTEIRNWTHLVHFSAHNNRLTGVIPSQLGVLTKLQSFYVDSNLLTGELPPHLGNITTLKEFSVGDNQLTGTVPEELGWLVNDGALKLLNLTHNDGLYGDIPAPICNLTDDPALGNVLEFDCGNLCGCDCDCDNVSAFVLIGENGTVLAESNLAASNETVLAESKSGGL